MQMIRLRRASGIAAPAPIRMLAMAIALLLIGVQVTRVLLVPAPALEIATGQLVDLRFADPACRPDPLLAMSRYEDRFSLHPGDTGAVRRCVSEPFATGEYPQLLIRYAGQPSHRGIRTGLDLDLDGHIDLPLQLGRSARHGWLVATVPLPEQARHRTVQLVVADESAQAEGWLTVRDIVLFRGQAAGLTGAAPWPGVLAPVCAGILAVSILWLGARRYAAGVVAGMAALVAVEFLQIGAFYLRDDYVLLSTFADGIRWSELVAYYDQLMPLSLAVYAAAVSAVGAWYAPLQVLMTAGHVLVSLLLVALLTRHGFPRWLSLCLGLLFASSWAHAEVVPWFLSGCFMGQTALTLFAVERTIAHSQGQANALGWAVGAAALAPLVFAGGAVASWLCLAYILLFARPDRRAALLFTVIGVGTVALILLMSPAMESAIAAAGKATVIERLWFLVNGALASSLASLLALRHHLWVAVAALAGIGIVGLASGHGGTFWQVRSLVFGAAWLAAAYGLQAAVRTNTGFGDSMSLRYTYFGMTGAAFAVAAWLHPLADAWRTGRDRIRRGCMATCLGATVLGVVLNTAALEARMDAEEREYFDTNRQYFALTRSALAWASAQGMPAPAGRVPKTVFPFIEDSTPPALTARFRDVVCSLDACETGGDSRSGARPTAEEQMPAIWVAALPLAGLGVQHDRARHHDDGPAAIPEPPPMKVSVILPTYNEADNIVPLIGEVLASLHGHETEVLVIDDDSPDGTWRVAASAPCAPGQVRIMRRLRDRGLVASLTEGFGLARGEVVCWMDADFSMPPSTLPRLVDAVAAGADLAVASRNVPGGGDHRDDVRLHRFLGRLLTAVSSLLLVPQLSDYTSGFVAIRRTTLDSLLPLEGDYGEYCIPLLYNAWKRGFRVVELPYVCVPRRAGESKTATRWWGYFTRGWGYVRMLVRVRLRAAPR